MTQCLFVPFVLFVFVLIPSLGSASIKKSLAEQFQQNLSTRFDASKEQKAPRTDQVEAFKLLIETSKAVSSMATDVAKIADTMRTAAARIRSAGLETEESRKQDLEIVKKLEDSQAVIQEFFISTILISLLVISDPDLLIKAGTEAVPELEKADVGLRKLDAAIKEYREKIDPKSKPEPKPARRGRGSKPA